MPGTRRGAPDSRRPARAGIPAELPETSRCRSGFCGDVARAARSGASRATAPRRFERACGRWGSKGRRRGALPLAASAGSDSPRRLRLLLRWGHGRLSDNAQKGALPGRLAGWCVGDARDLTRSRGFAVADPGGRLHLPASVVEVHVAARRLRRIVPLGIRPNGTIPLRGEKPSSGSTRPFELPSGFFIMRKAVAAIRRRNTLSAVPLAIQKPAGKANNQTYRRLQRFFVLTKGISLIGPRPERPAFCQEFEKRIHGWDYRTLVRPGLSGLAQVTGGYDLLPKEKVVLDLWNLGCADNPQLLRLASSGVAC